jgi:hypothetical protein
MIRTALIICGGVLWLLCFAIAMFTIIPLSGMALAAIFGSGFTFSERLAGLGIVAVGLIVIAALLFALTRMTRILTKRPTVS